VTHLGQLGRACTVYCSCRHPDMVGLRRCANLDVSDDRAVAVDIAGAAGALEAIEGEHLAGDELARRLRIERLRYTRPHRERPSDYSNNHKRKPRTLHYTPPNSAAALRH